MDSFDLDEITLQDLELRESGGAGACHLPGTGASCLRREKIIPFQRHPGKAPGVDPETQHRKIRPFLSGIITPGHVGIGF